MDLNLCTLQVCKEAIQLGQVIHLCLLIRLIIVARSLWELVSRVGLCGAYSGWLGRGRVVHLVAGGLGLVAAVVDLGALGEALVWFGIEVAGVLAWGKPAIWLLFVQWFWLLLGRAIVSVHISGDLRVDR